MEQTKLSIDGCLVKINPGEGHVSITIQENKNGKFGRSKTIPITYDELGEALENVSQEEFMKELVQEAKEEWKEDKSWKMPKIKLPSIMNAELKKYIVGSLLFVAMVSLLYLGTQAFGKDQRIARLLERIIQLESEIAGIRAEREREFDACIETCYNQRKPYDEKVIDRQSQIQGLETRIDEIR